MTDLLALDATDQIRALEAGTVSAGELLEMALARNAALHARLNAIVASDPDRARAAARSIDEARAQGRPLGLLAGLPMTVKDTYDVEGMPASGGGVRAYRDRPGVKDALTIARVKAEGAVIWGKSNSPIMAGDWQAYNKLYGTTNNPWDVTRGPGGSSGGSGVSLATQISALEMGSDIAGSLRIPAAFCGVFAHKPTFELVPRAGHVPPPPGALSPRDLSVVGPMARSARDLALLLHVMTAGATPRRIAPSDPKTLRIGLWLDEPAFHLDPEVRAVTEAWVERARAAGFDVRPLTAPVDGLALLETYNVLLMAQIASGFPEPIRERLYAERPAALAERRQGAAPLSYAATVLASTASHRDWLIADEARYQLKARIAQVFEGVDVIVSPTTAVAPFVHDHSDFNHRQLRTSDGGAIPYNSMMMWIALATVCGLPATAMPAGFTPVGLPVGVQIIGPERGDAATLAAAQALEAALGGYVAPPL